MSCCGRIHVKVTFLALSSMDIAWSWVSERNAVCDFKGRLAMLLRCKLPNKSNQYILWSWFQLTNRSILVWVFLFLSICVQIDCYNYNATSRLTTRYKLSIWVYRFNTFIQNNLGTSNRLLIRCTVNCKTVRTFVVLHGFTTSNCKTKRPKSFTMNYM